jgi:hypothetical protein
MHGPKGLLEASQRAARSSPRPPSYPRTPVLCPRHSHSPSSVIPFLSPPPGPWSSAGPFLVCHAGGRASETRNIHRITDNKWRRSPEAGSRSHQQEPGLGERRRQDGPSVDPPSGIAQTSAKRAASRSCGRPPCPGLPGPTVSLVATPSLRRYTPAGTVLTAHQGPHLSTHRRTGPGPGRRHAHELPGRPP